VKFRGREGGGRVGPNVFADVEFSGKTMDGGNLALGERFAVLTSSEPWKNDTERTYLCLKIAALGAMLMGIGPCLSVLEGVHSGLKVIRDQKHRLFVLQAHQDTTAGSLQR
jgi:hypothetical protein